MQNRNVLEGILSNRNKQTYRGTQKCWHLRLRKRTGSSPPHPVRCGGEEERGCVVREAEKV